MYRCGVALALSFALLSDSVAQPYPSRPITMVVTGLAGGITDIIARIVTDRMRPALGQPFVIDNIGGAAGMIAVQRFHRAPPDGYTFIVGQWSSHVGAGVVAPPGFDYIEDFDPVSLISVGTVWLVGNKDLPPKDGKELVSWLKANPSRGAAGTTGPGGGIHVCLAYFQKLTGLNFQIVPYRGAPQMLSDLMSGQLDLSCPEAGQTLGHYRSGNLKAFAVLRPDRWFAAPDVPTMDEIGLAGLHFPFWHAMWAPKGTPKEIVQKVNAALVEALADAEVRKRLQEQLGHEVVSRERQSPEALRAFHKAEIEKWTPIIKDAMKSAK